MKNLILTVLTAIVFHSCSSEQLGDNSASCTSYSPHFANDICNWFSNQAVISENIYDGNCVRITGVIWTIQPLNNEVKITLACGNISHPIRCTVNSSLYKEQLSFLSKLKVGDLVEIYGIFNHNYSTLTRLHNLKILPHKLEQDFSSEYSDCKFLGKKWSLIQPHNGVKVANYFAKNNNEHYWYQSTKLYDEPLAKFKVQERCSRMQIEWISTGEIEMFDIAKLTDNEFVLENSSQSFLFFR